MATKTNAALRKLRTADDLCRLLTGKRLNEVLGRGIELFGGDAIDKMAEQKVTDPEEIVRLMPYRILGINPDAPDFLVKAAYKAQIKECHPDTTKADEEKARRINNAYEQICRDRKIPK